MKLHEAIRLLEDWAPNACAEGFDNTGLLVGGGNETLTGILVCHDTLEEVVGEAIENNCNLIVGYHPILFDGLKKITGKTYVERAVIKAIQNKIAIYALHTALDNQPHGTNKALGNAIGLENLQILIPQSSGILKLITYVPKNHAESLKESLFESGAGNIGNYDQCSFSLEGKGTFRGNEHSKPAIGEKGKRHTEEEVQLGVVFPNHLKESVLNALLANHPYEEVAYELYQTLNDPQDIGMGMIGSLPGPMKENEFLNHLKDKLNLKFVRHSGLSGKEIRKVAVLAGSGAFSIGRAIARGADALVTGDLKYHQFYESEGKILLADVGHFESEQFTKYLIHDYLVKKIPNFAVVLSKLNTNPIHYT